MEITVKINLSKIGGNIYMPPNLEYAREKKEELRKAKKLIDEVLSKYQDNEQKSQQNQ